MTSPNVHTGEHSMRNLLINLKSILIIAVILLGVANSGCNLSSSTSDISDPVENNGSDDSPGSGDDGDLEEVEPAHSEWSKNRSMYQVNLRAFSDSGTLAGFEEHLDRLAELNVGILYFMPMHPIGEINTAGSVGSPYAVKDFRQLNPDFGTPDDFRRVVEGAHERDMKVIIDWVPNHTSWDNDLTETNPDWYEQENGEFFPPRGTNWNDVIQLDHSNPELREYFIETLILWLDEYGIDGFRFDAVSYVSTDFWKEVLPEIRRHKPEVFLLAEGTGSEWYDIGFDASYNWQFYGFEHGFLVDFVNGDIDAEGLFDLLKQNVSAYPEAGYQLYFTTNHDENAWHGTTQERFGDAADALFVLAATFDGMPMMYNGQEAGLDYSINFLENDKVQWGDISEANLYSVLFGLRKNNRALWSGEHGGNPAKVNVGSEPEVMAYYREREDDLVMVVLNLSDDPADVEIVEAPGAEDAEWRNVFLDETKSLHDGAVIALPPWGYKVYEAGHQD